jgi:Ca-activated chloride channel family protein
MSRSKHSRPVRSQSTPSSGRFWRFGLSVSAGSAALIVIFGLFLPVSQAQEFAGQPSQELLIEALDAKGQVITDQLSSSLEVMEAGEKLQITDLGEVGDQWRIVLYFDQLLASPTDFHNATIQLGERARDLARLGTVELLTAGQEVSTALPQNREPDALSQALGWMRLRDTSENLQAELRLSFLEQLTPEPEGSVVWTSEDVAELAQMFIADESELLRRFREQLLLWGVSHATPGPKALFLIGTGFDADPLPFYRDALVEGGWPSAALDLLPAEVGPSVAELGKVLSVYGWTVLPYTPGQRGDALLDESEEELAARKEDEVIDVIFQDGQMVDKTTIGFDPAEVLKRRRERRAASQERPILLNAEQPFRGLADSTGGELLRGKYQLSDVLVRLSQRYRIGVVSAARPAGTVDELVVRVDLGSEGQVPLPAMLRSRRWISETTPETVSAVRARQILAEELDDGDLVISAAVQPLEDGGETRLIVKRDPYLSGSATSGPLRVTMAVANDDGTTEIQHLPQTGWETLADGDLDGDPTLDLALAEEPEGLVVVLIEELDSGLWGGTFATFVEATGIARGGYENMLLPAPQVIHLMAPAQGFAMGPTEFETVISDPQVARVDFYMDDQREAVSRTAPFKASLDLGSLPQPRRVEVVALDQNDRELGRDYLVVNEGSGVFGVRIVSPKLVTEDGKPRQLIGPVDVEAEVEPRRGEGIDRVEFYWNETLVATRFARPFRQRVVIPQDDPSGFLRVVAFLDDGNMSEDLVLVNSSGPSERLQVNLMELYVVVTDRHGRPVKGLDRDVFRVTEEKEDQEIATFSDAGDLPLTVGMVIDSSASMFVKLPDVQFAASEFLRGLATRRDRAFVVGFGSEPQLTRSTTSDLPDIIRSMDRLRPDGQTAIWKAIVYSLVQLQGVPGKKALIVYTDGADEDPDFSYRTTLKFARKVGVPVYVVLSNNEIRRTEGKGLQVKGFLGRLETLTESVGGKIFMARVGEDLQNVYKEIDEELRSQYVVGYYSQDTGGREWRNVEVDVDQPGLKARTIAGYYR